MSFSLNSIGCGVFRTVIWHCSVLAFNHSYFCLFYKERMAFSSSHSIWLLSFQKPRCCSASPSSTMTTSGASVLIKKLDGTVTESQSYTGVCRCIMGNYLNSTSNPAFDRRSYRRKHRELTEYTQKDIYELH